uniref:Uncharacterized protein n=1 Tax=Moniliophthora roreri TaxID=221103 RepID=A0A0W0FHM9_MONRR
MAITDYIPDMKRRKDDKLVTQSSARSPEASPEVSRPTPGMPNSAESDVVMEQSSTHEDDGKGSEGRTKRMTRRRSAIRQAKAEDTSSEDTVMTPSSRRRGEVKRLNGQVDFGKKQIQTLRKQLDEARSRLEHQSNQVDKLKEHNENLTRAFKINKQELHDSKSQCDHLDAQVCALREQCLTVNAESTRLEAQLHSQTMQLGNLQKKYNADRQMLELRTKELQGAQEYLHATRTYSSAELIRLVKSLNGEMMQAAAIITEALKLEQVDSPSRQVKA